MVELEEVWKTYRGQLHAAVAGIDLTVQEGEFFSLLGPSGSGKTTTLRMISGFEQPSSGRVLLDGADVSQQPAYRRDVNTVFQNYALFPHMTVARNVAYPLKMRDVPKRETAERVDQALAAVGMSGYEGRLPQQLSGGQRQRVALARALVGRPRVLLLDEPLGALDLHLRQQMQTMLKHLQREVGITFIYVTHDQGEALSMSDRLAVMNAGRVEQVGTPEEVYYRPNSAFVASFIGKSNLLDLEVEGDHSRLGPTQFPTPGGGGSRPGPRTASLRYEAVTLVLGSPPAGHVVVDGVIEEVAFLGDAVEVVTRVGSQRIIARIAGSRPSGFEIGASVHVAFRPDDLVVLHD